MDSTRRVDIIICDTTYSTNSQINQQNEFVRINDITTDNQ